MDLRELSDEALMERVQQDDRQAFRVLYERHQGPVYGFLLRRVRDRDEAAERFQDTWLKVHRGRHTYRVGHAFRPWLYGVAVNTLRDAYRKQGRRVVTVDFESAPPLEAPVRERPVQKMTLEAALEQLPDSLREAFLLGAVMGFDHNEVSEALGISRDNARTRISRARKKLRELLEGA